ncbi:MAG: rhodanese-like domain-containing protein [Bacteroidetes bacterium]|nr:rhodanese-like domain-containing protein [Bacteroidota bacterium]MBS1541733.1 rhodanese-like domain-containing protein [Bacteroidota bacterium]
MKNILLTTAFSFIFITTFSQVVHPMKVDDFEKKMSATKEKTILDVRTPEEFVEGHLPGA